MPVPYSVHMYTFTFVCLQLCVYVLLNTHAHTRMHTLTHTRTHTHTLTHTHTQGYSFIAAPVLFTDNLFALTRQETNGTPQIATLKVYYTCSSLVPRPQARAPIPSFSDIQYSSLVPRPQARAPIPSISMLHVKSWLANWQDSLFSIPSFIIKSG